jgi:dihydropteridine reductase
MEVLGADVVELPSEWLGSWELDGFVHLPREATLQDLTVRMVRGVHSFLLNRTNGSRNPLRLDAIICASGGWQADPRQAAAAMETEYDIECGAQAYTAAIQRMLHMNLDPVLAATYVAQHYMDTGGLMVVMGATAALQPTPGMLGYGLAKAASHHVVRTLGASTGKSLESKSVRQAGAKVRRHVDAMDTLTVVGILPTMIDTPANRKADPSGKFEQWTKPRDIAVEIGTWLKQPALRPHSGSLIKVHPQHDGNGATFELVR